MPFPTMHHLKKHCQTVYDQYLSKPFTDTSITWDWHLQGPGYTIQRPNHGLAHTLRVANYAPMVLEAFQNSPNKEEAAKYVGLEKDLDKIQIALLFAVAARTNETGFSDNKTKYMEMRANCVEAFKKYAETLEPPVFTPQEIEHYGNTLYNFGAPDTKDPLSMIFKACHKLDLPRCFDEQRAAHSLDEIEGPMGKENLQKLKDYALQCLVQTGDRIIGNFGDDKGLSYNTEVFPGVSTNVSICLDTISSVPPPAIIPLAKKEESEVKWTIGIKPTTVKATAQVPDFKAPAQQQESKLATIVPQKVADAKAMHHPVGDEEKQSTAKDPSKKESTSSEKASALLKAIVESVKAFGNAVNHALSANKAMKEAKEESSNNNRLVV